MNVLMNCNTVYHVFVAVWLKQSVLSQDHVDIIISDHMNNSERISQSIRTCGIFNEVYYAKTKELCSRELSRKNRIFCMLHANLILKKYVCLKKRYDAFFTANLDMFAKLIFHTLSNDSFCGHRNKNLSIFLYEDGLSSYSTYFKQVYDRCNYHQKFSGHFYHPRQIFGNISGMYYFEPQALSWVPDAPVIPIPQIDVSDIAFKKNINTIFDYENSTDIYDKKYLFMEEAYYADTGYTEDIKLVECIANTVGKENIMVKIHPRNPENRFQALGYKTNKDTAIPWEVILLNNNIQDKMLFTIASTSVLSPLMFNQSPHTFILYSCLKNVPDVLKGPLWDACRARFCSCENITLLDTLDQLPPAVAAES